MATTERKAFVITDLPTHTNSRALVENTWDHRFVHHKLDSRDTVLHEHYARNALALGHSETCIKVTLPVNWPTMFGHPLCSCDAAHGQRERERLGF